MFAVAQCQTFEVRASDYGSWNRCLRRRRSKIIGFESIAAVHLLGLALLLGDLFCGRQVGYHPAKHSGKQVVAYFATVAKINIFQIFRLVCHFQNGLTSDVPYAFHPPGYYAGSTRIRQSAEAFVRKMEAIADIDMSWTRSNKRTDDVREDMVVNKFAVRGKVEVVQ
jgi:hypothetical protein